MRVFALTLAVALLSPGRPAVQSSLPAIRDLLQAYWDGDLDVVSRRLPRAQDVERLAPALKAWIVAEGSASWPIATSVLLLDLAAAALRTPEPATRTALQLLEWGRLEITSKQADADARANRDLEKHWHQTALGLLQGVGAFREQQEYLRRIEARFPNDPPVRFWLARGIAREQQAGSLSSADAASALEAAAGFYDRAARVPDQRAEASARAAAIYIRLNRPRDAMRRLDVAGDTADAAVAGWLPRLRSQALTALGETAEAQLNAEVAAKIAASAGAADPEVVLKPGDARFVAEWLPRLRAYLRADDGGAVTRSPAMMALDDYQAGRFQPVVESLGKLPSLAKFAEDYLNVAARWAAEAGPAHVDRRRAVAALVALEAAWARGGAEWGQAQGLLESACAKLRGSRVPTELERRWMQAAAALIEGAAAGAALEIHVTHALLRFPGDPMLVMARAVAAELRAGPDVREASRTRAPTLPIVDPNYPVTADPLDAVVARLQEAAKLEEYRQEAQLRLGYTALRRGQAEAALGYFASALPAGSGSDPFLEYLVHLLRGRALERLKRWDDAVTTYEQAVGVRPGAQTAELALAAALARAGRRADAAARADRALEQRGAVPDPWLSYGQSDFRHWAVLIDRLRSAIQ
jgi:tetratricopeptide (TPR) repeat protein